jgi:DNA-directed RNA polymerase subunit RPC12/RpoP
MFEARQPHTDRSTPCPTCGFRVREVPRQPFVFDEDDLK